MSLPIPALRRVRHVAFDELSADGADVRVFDDGATAPAFDEEALEDLREHWKGPRPAVVPKVATLRDVVLFREASRRCPTRETAISTPRSPATIGEAAATAGFRVTSTAKPATP